jgi:hypothetical protein
MCGGYGGEEGKDSGELGYGKSIWPIDGLLGHWEVHK